MIQYNKYKRFYAEPGLFTLSGSSYEGYVEVLSGSPYVSNPLDSLSDKCSTNTQSVRVPLDKLTTYRTDLLCSDFFYDRYVSDSSILPVSLEDILIQPNDFLNYGLIGEKLKLLNTNTTYTYSRCLLPDNKLPYSSENVKFASIDTTTNTTLSVMRGFQDSVKFADNLTFADIGNIKGVTVKNNIDDVSKSVIFAFTDTKLISLSCDDTNMSVIESSPYYVTNTVENILTFSSIGGAICVGTDLFITDTGNNTIIKYDISGYVNNDKALANKRNLIEIVGGRGQARDNLLFNSPTLLTTDDKHVIVYDSNNFIIKVLDTDLNFITRISSVNLRTEQFITFEYNRLTGRLYILTQSTTGIKVYVLDEMFNIADIYTLQLTLENLEVINNIVFSLSDSNYFYICTNFSIYKLLVNRPGIIIGRFDSSRFYTSARSSDTFANSLWNYVNIPFNEAAYIWNADNTDFAAGVSSSIFNDTFKGIRLTSQSTNSDKLFFISSSRIYYFNEQHNLSTVLKEPNFENFGNTLTLDKSEYIQTSTINKELYKVVRDIIELKNNIVGRFTGYYDDRNVFTYTDYNYNINLTEIYSQLPSNYYIHDNEKNILGVLNRTITEIYTLQEQLIKLTTADLGEELAPILNYGTTQISNVLIIE